MLNKIVFISSEGCKDCLRMKKTISEVLNENKLKYKDLVIEIDSEDDMAIDTAIKEGIGDIPGCSFGKSVICGANFNADFLKNSLKRFLRPTA